MDLADEFEVALPLDEAWTVLTDLERVAPCMPGAQLDEVADGEFKGRVRVKVGPITVEYRGVARFTSVDARSHVMELHAEGREARGQGAAKADVRASLTAESPERTKVVVTTSLDVSGRVAQFGRGALADVSARLMRQFVENLERSLTGGPAEGTTGVVEARDDVVEAREVPRAAGPAPQVEPAEGATAATAPSPPRPSVPAAAPISAARLLGPVLLKRLLPPVVLGAIALVVRRLRSRRRG